jgi:hypothetical protein
LHRYIFSTEWVLQTLQDRSGVVFHVASGDLHALPSGVVDLVEGIVQLSGRQNYQELDERRVNMRRLGSAGNLDDEHLAQLVELGVLLRE